MKKKNIDEVIVESLHEEINNIEVTNMDNVWGKIENNLTAKKRFRNKYRYTNKLVASFVGIAVLGAVLLWPKDMAYTDYLSLLKFIFNEDNNSIRLNIDHTKPRESEGVLDENENPLKIYTLQLEEAKEIADFKVLEPTYMMEGYILKEVVIAEVIDATVFVKMTYTSSDSTIIGYEQRHIKGDYAEVMEVNTDISKVEQIYNNNVEYNVITNKDNGNSFIIWNTDDVRYELKGYNREDLLKIAFSIK